ncbi:MAG: ribosome-associated translation inhibitor RaiA [bacterium]|nr:ribosome-associated translation inhibitor RaiA [bacterium]
MHLDITGRHVDVTAALKDFAEEKLSKLERLLGEPIEVHVVLAIEKHRHIAEIQVKTRNSVFSGTQETGDLYASIGEVADKLERQALKHKDKMRDHKHRKGPRDPEVAAAISANVAAAQGDSENAPPAAVEPPRIVRTHSYRLKPMSAEDALMELEGNGDDLLVFRNAADDRVRVVYRQKDGNFALVEPEF